MFIFLFICIPLPQDLKWNRGYHEWLNLFHKELNPTDTHHSILHDNVFFQRNRFMPGLRCYCVNVIAHILRMNQPSNFASFQKNTAALDCDFLVSHRHLFSMDPVVKLSETIISWFGMYLWFGVCLFVLKLLRHFMDFGMEVGDGQTKTIGYHGNQRFRGFGAEIWHFQASYQKGDHSRRLFVSVTRSMTSRVSHRAQHGTSAIIGTKAQSMPKNLGRVWFVYTYFQGD